MASNLFEQLADLEVPPPPVQFDSQLHERVNRSLVISHFVDLLVNGLPWTLGRFFRALVAAISFTLTGRYESDTKHKDTRRDGT